MNTLIFSKLKKVVFLLLLISSTLFSQHYFTTHKGMPEFDRLDLSQNISDFTVNDILRDRNGYMWFATSDGAFRYDGYNYKAFRHQITGSNSISGNIVQSLFEDSHGLLWFGTTTGLTSFDRRKMTFKQFTHAPDNPASLSGDEVYDIFEDHRGNLWIGTWGGLDQYNPKDGTFSPILQSTDSTSGLPDNRVMDINEDRWGVLWVATLNGLCAIFQDQNGGRRFFHFRDRPGDQTTIYGNSVYWVHVDPANRLWVGTHSGFLQIKYTGPGETGDGLNDVSFSRILPLKYSQGEDEIFWKIANDHKGNLWLASWGNGLIYYNPQSGEVQRYKHDPDNPASLSDNTIGALYVDPDSVGNALWVGNLHGVEAYFPDKRKFPHFRHSPEDPASLSNDHVHSALEDTRGNLWIGTMEGLNLLKPGTDGFIHYFNDTEDPHSLSSNLVLSIYEDRKQNLWLGTYNNLNRYDYKTGHFLKDKKLSNTDDRALRVYAFCEDDAGYLWMGARHGLIRYNPENHEVKKYAPETGNRHSLPNEDVRALFIDSRGFFWVGTTGGLTILDKTNGKFFRFSYLPDNPDGLSDPTIWKVFEDSRGTIWIATNGGLNKLIHRDNPAPATWKFKHYTENDGLPSNHINGILEDGSGFLWLSTKRGVSKFDPAKESFKNYDSKDGLQSNDFSNAGQFKMKDGSLLFGGINGLNVFHPDSIKENNHVPPLVISSFKIFDTPAKLEKDINLTKKITLGYQETFFSFEFAALDYTDPQKNQYAYMMEGFDPQWVQSGRRRYASYTNLDPGEYVFRVKGSNNDGVWNEKGTSIRITIIPPPWRTWWAYTIYVLLAVALLFALRRYEMNKTRRKEQEMAKLREAHLRAETAEARAKTVKAEKEVEKQILRNRIATDLHDEIGSNLSSISLISEVVQNRQGLNPEIRNIFIDVNRVARSSTEAIRDIVWFINPMSDQLKDLITRMKETANIMLGAIKYQVLSPEIETEKKLHPEVKRNLYLIYKESLNNIIKHSKATEVKILILEEYDKLTMHISDNGKGFDAPSVKKGNGLRNIRIRADQIGAGIEIISKPGEGAHISVSVKIT